MPYRLGRLHIDDPDLGRLEIEGDGFAAAGEPVTLVVEPTVQEHLQMLEEERAVALGIVRAYRQAVSAEYASGDWVPPHRHPGVRRARQEAEARLDEMLGPERASRLQRLSWRLRGADALLDDDLASVLRLSDEQREALMVTMDAREAGKTEIFEAIRGVRLATAEPLEELGRRYELSTSELLLAVLKPRQREEFDRITRPPAAP